MFDESPTSNTQTPPRAPTHQVIPKTLNPVFDDSMVVNLRSLDREEFEQGVINISVMDADTFTRNDLIGSYSFDATSVPAML